METNFQLYSIKLHISLQYLKKFKLINCENKARFDKREY